MSGSSKCVGMYMSADFFHVEMRILDDAEKIAEGVVDHRDLDALAHVLERLVDFRAHLLEPRHLGRGIGDAPIRERPLRAGPAVGNEAELEAAARIAHVERLVEVRLGADELAVPSLRLG